ncbi:MAG: flagellar basal-body MS-ring/collar protein FliF [Oscillospiraceae bacterium]|nr:flagellar basal-body MS-ring/collar protein FliF [Oscillospiraceae bacterium]
MNMSISGFFNQIGGYFGKMSKKKRITIISVISVVIVGAVIVAAVLNKSSYTVLYRGLSSSEGAEIMQILDKLNTDYKVDASGAILVPYKDEAVLKMQLAAEGYPKNSLSYDLFTNASSLITTDFEKKQYLIFQLQDRLQDAIKTLNGVNNAIVTLNISSDSSFVLKKDETESTASVVLDLSPSAQLSSKQIRGIEALVSKSVSGLSAENVVIIDGDGTILNNNNEPGIGEAYTQLELINNINKLYEDKIFSLLEPVLGKNGLSVSANVVIDFTTKSKEETVYTPVTGESGIISHSEFDNKSTNGGTVAEGAAGTESNTGTPTYKEDDGTESGSSASASGSTDYLVNRMIQTIIDNGGTIKDMTVAVMINKSDLSEETEEQYRELIAYGTGISSQKVAIAHAQFLSADKEPEKPAEDNPKTIADLLGIDELMLYVIIGAALFIIVVSIIIISVIKRKIKNKKLQQIMAEASKAAPKKVTDIPGEIVLGDTREKLLKKQIKDFSASNPEIVAQLLRSWMKEDDAK